MQKNDSRVYETARYNKMTEETFQKIRDLAVLKGGEYSGDLDRLENFRRNAAALELDYRQIWAVYAAKHWDAVMQYIKDEATGKQRRRVEPIAGRCDDLIVYLLLLKAMLEEQSTATRQTIAVPGQITSPAASDEITKAFADVVAKSVEESK